MAQSPYGPAPYGQHATDPAPVSPPAGPYGPANTIITTPYMGQSFQFNGGAASYFGMSVAVICVTVFTLGICYPWAVKMRYAWRANHTLVNGRQLRFTGTATGLFGNWIKWALLCIITIGIYAFWVGPRLTKWIVEHQEFVA